MTYQRFDDAFALRKYTHWRLFLERDQYYLGRCVVVSKRPYAYFPMKKVDRDELFDSVIPTWNNAVHTLFLHDGSNINSFFSEQRLCWNLIPRYKEPRTFANIKFIGEYYGETPLHNPAGYLDNERLLLLSEYMHEVLH